MNSIHSSKVIALGVLLAVALAAAGTAAAITVDGTSPAPAEVGETVTHEVTINEPFRDAPNEWELEGQTELEDASWTIQEVAQGDPVNTEDVPEQSFTYDLDREDGATEVTIEVTGTVPDLTTYDYRELANENYTAIGLARSGTEIETFTGHRYTTGDGEEIGSLEARQAIDNAIEAAGGENDNIERAISSYDNGNFENAHDLATEAEGGAQTTQMLMIGAGVIVVLALVGGGVYYYREQQKTGNKLQ